MSGFSKGDKVRCNSDVWGYATKGDVYHVYKDTGGAGGGQWAYIIDDDGDENEYPLHDFSLVSAGAACSTPCTNTVHASVSGEVTVTEIDDELSYDACKAQQSVTSCGMFNAGQVLVYRDGTPTLTALTVTTCTSTCVWFNETYSMPFNPEEFKVEH